MTRYELRTTKLATFPGQVFPIGANEEIPESMVEAMRADKLELWQIKGRKARRIN